HRTRQRRPARASDRRPGPDRRGTATPALVVLPADPRRGDDRAADPPPPRGGARARGALSRAGTGGQGGRLPLGRHRPGDPCRDPGAARRLGPQRVRRRTGEIRMTTTPEQVTAQPTYEIEDLYPLTPLQHGMLVHTLLAPGSGMYIVQTGVLIEGDLDPAAFRRAWELLIARQPVLRSAVVYEGVAGPLAVVARSVPLPYESVDWRGLDEAAQEAAIQDYLDRDRLRGFDFDQPGLTRIFVARLGERRHHLVWTYHHLLLDGWSVPLVLGDLFDAYQ